MSYSAVTRVSPSNKCEPFILTHQVGAILWAKVAVHTGPFWPGAVKAAKTVFQVFVTSFISQPQLFDKKNVSVLFLILRNLETVFTALTTPDQNGSECPATLAQTMAPTW